MKKSDLLAQVPYWQLSVAETAETLDTDVERGLSTTEVEKRLAIFGHNTFEPAKKANGVRIFLRQLTGPLILVLIAAGVVTLSIAHYRDAAFIFIAVVINSLLGFWQENKAERALAELKTYLKPRARVIREAVEREIDAEDLVPGDILRLAQGDRVSADARLLFVNDLQVDESVLTGESLTVEKAIDPVPEEVTIADQTSMLFAGTLVTQGVCSAIVCRTDAHTELGKIATLIASSQEEKTPLQKAITTLSLWLSAVLGFLTVAIFAGGILSGRPVLEMFLTAVAVAVSAIPEGLPISMTVILAIGVERMAKRKGVVRKLVAAEALGSTTLILTDKTGTLTAAKMELSKVIPLVGNEEDLLMRALTNASVLIENPEEPPAEWRMDGKIMETALVQSAALRGVSLSTITDKSHVLETRPFNSAHKFSISLTRGSGEHRLVLFGAPDILLAHSSLSETAQKDLLTQIDALASSGERVLGLATKKVHHTENFSLTKDFKPAEVIFEGLLTFRDPVRPGVPHAIERVRRAGVRTVIMTGDHKGTAIAIAREVGIAAIDTNVLDASELAALDDAALKERLPQVTVISRVTPFDKLRIVKLYQSLGEVVAMTGDGVNDAPAIKQADVGIAMGSGTEVAQGVADLVLLDDNFETIVAAIEEGRQIFGNIRKVLVYLLSNVTDSLILIGGSIVAGVPLPLNALQILWVNFFSDSFPAVAFAFEKEADALTQRPRRGKVVLFDPLVKVLVAVIGISTSALLFVMYMVLLAVGQEPELVRTFIFAAFGTYTLLVAFSVRSLERSIFSYSPFSNQYLTGGVLIGIALVGAAVYLPLLQTLFGTVALPLIWVLGVVLVGLFDILLIELAKAFFRRRLY